MPGIFDLGQVSFGVEDCKIAVNNLDGTWGTLVDVPSIQLYGVEYNTTNAQLEGDDKITATHSRAISATCRIRMGSVSLDVINIMTGQAIADSAGGAAASQARSMRMRNANFPYFGICARADAVEGGGDTHVFIPKLKIMEGFSFQFEYGAFVIPEFTAMGVADSAFFSDIFDIVMYKTARSTIVMPPLFTVP